MPSTGNVSHPSTAYEIPRSQLLSTEMQTQRQKGCVVHWVNENNTLRSYQTFAPVSLLSGLALKKHHYRQSSKHFSPWKKKMKPVWKTLHSWKFKSHSLDWQIAQLHALLWRQTFMQQGFFLFFFKRFLFYPDYFLHCKNILKTWTISTRYVD